MAAPEVSVTVNQEAWAQFARSADGPVGKALARAALDVQDQAKQLLSKPGSGRTYTRRSVTHRASAPGDPPAVNTGRLRSSITHRVAVDDQGVFAEVGSNVRYARFLELGTSKMAKRPFLRPALLTVAQRMWGRR